MEEASWISLEIRNKVELVKSPGFTLVPKVVFDPPMMPTYLKDTGIELKDDANIAFDEIPFVEAMMVYESNSDADQASYSKLIYYLSIVQAQEHSSFMHFQIDVDGLLIVVFKDSKLHFANRFIFKAKEDILYYLVAVANNYKLNLEHVLVSYSGFLRPKTELKNLLHQYIKKLKPMELSEQLSFDLAINPVHQAYYADLFILPLCGL